MSDRVRGALFNALGDITGLQVLDPFAGSGALSFEALSRGAASALLIENDPVAQRAVAGNIAGLGLQGKARLVRANCVSWSNAHPNQQFDLVLADPPYDDISLPVVQKLVRHVDEEGLYVLSWPGKQEAPALDGFAVVEAKSYGDAQLLFYRRG